MKRLSVLKLSRFNKYLTWEKLLSKKFLVVYLISLYTTLWIIGFVFIDKKTGDNLKLTDLPYQEKVADGVWALKNRDPIRQVLAEGKKADLTIKEIKNYKSNLKSEDKYKYGVTNANGTKFEFGFVDSKTPKGKVAPVVRVVNKEGWFVRYAPKYESRSMNQESSKEPENPSSADDHDSQFIIHNSVVPKVNKNVISWEISKGVVARYTMMQDRVKADYIVNHKSSIINHRLDFDVVSGNINNKPSSANKPLTINNQQLRGELMPGGDIDWFVNSVDSEGLTQTQFTFPAPIVNESRIKNQESSKETENPSSADDHNSKFMLHDSIIGSKYGFEKVKDGQYSLAIILDKEDLESASWPLTIDPVVIAVANFEGTQFTNGRKIIRDQWGNLIVHFRNDSDASANIYYKNYNSSSWVDDTTTIAEIQTDPAIDLDSAGNVHLAFRNAGDIFYNKINVTRNGSNAITSIAWEDTSVSFKIDDAGDTGRPSLIIANRGGGAGVEKVAVAHKENVTAGTIVGEIRFMQCDVADDCTVASNWKNASEERNGNGACSTATSGDVGLPSTTDTCEGTADVLFSITAAYTKHNAVLTQIPGKPKRSPASVKKDINGSFTDLNNLEDGSSGTTDNINSLTTTDYLYVGDLKPFSKIAIDIDTTNTNIQTFTTTQYCSANSDVDTTCDTWSSVSNFIDNTAGPIVVTATLQDPGDAGLKGSFLFDEPSNWVQSTENGTKELWTRFRPSGALDSTVSLADIYLTDRNSKALMVVGGVDSTDDLGASYIPWDEIGNAGWENNPASAGVPWRDGITALDTLGGNYTTFTRMPLTAAIDYKNNGVYVAYMEDLATDVLHVKYAPNNKDLSVAASWTDIGFPTVTEAADVAFSLTADGADIYLFYVLDSDASDLAFRKCTPSGGGDGNVCDNANDWGSEKVLSAFTASTTEPTDPQAIVSKVTGDTVAIDVIYTNLLATVNVSYERHFVDLMDKTVVVAATGDDAYERNCVSGTDDQDNTTTVKLGREAADGSCSGGVDSENHIGIRFPNIIVAQGAVISSAYIDFRVTSRTGTGTIDFTIYGEDADNSATLTSFSDCADPCANGVNTRTKTTSNTTQSVDFVTNTYRIDVTDLVQEIVCRGAASSQPCVGDFNGAGTWASGNALSVLMISAEGGADNSILVSSFDHGGATMLDPTIQINCADSCSTVNPPNTTWASIGAGGNAAGDVNGNWDSRKKLTFDNRASSENLADFPVLVRLNSSVIDYTKTKSAGEDLRFVDADGSTLLDYEIEKWNESGESLVWVKVPSVALGVATDYVYMYYNNASGDAGQDIINTWDSYNKGVWHLGEGDSTASNFYQDSTTNNNDGTLTDADGTTNETTGVVGSAIDFGARDEDIINIVNSNSLNNTGSGWGASNPFTLSTWLRFDDTALTYQYMISKDASGSNTGDASLFFNNGASCTPNTARVSFYHQPPATCATSPLINQDQWYHYTFTIDSSNNGKLYQDGVLVATTGTYGTVWSNSTDLRFGNAVSSTFSYTGKIDEVRVSGGIARSADWIEAEYLSTKPNSSFVSIAAEQTVAGSVVHNYSFGSAVQLATGSASFTDFDHPLSSQEYVAVEGDDLSYVSIPATTVHASQSAQPAFMFKVNNPNNTNNYKIDASAVAKSTVPTSTKPVYLQVYRGGSTNNWVTMDTNNSTAGDTDFTLTSPSITANTSEYYFNETPGIGTRYAACTDSTANCWTYWRVYQDAPTSSLNEILAVDYVNVAFAANGPDKVAFSNTTRALTAGACNGTASVFTMELQQGSTPANPNSTTVVRVTSNSSSYTIYSDNTCATPVTNGDFTYTTAQNSKSVYIIDLSSGGTKTLTGTRQSGDTLTTGTQDYTLTDAPSAIIRGGSTIRGGSKIQ